MAVRDSADRSRLLFYLWLVWIVLLPWPLGANRDWIWPWFSAALLMLTAATVWCGHPLARWREAHGALRAALICLVAINLIDFARAIGANLWPTAAPWAADPDAALLGAFKGSTLWALALLAILLVGSRRRARWLLASVFVSGFLGALFALALSLGHLQLPWLGHRLGTADYATGTFLNRNHFAGMLELAGAAGFGLLASGLHTSERAANWREWLRRIGHALLGSRFAVRAGLAVIVVALVMSRSRMGNAGLFLGLTAAGLAALAWWRPLPRILIWLLLSIVAIDVLVLGAWVGVDKLAERVTSTRLVAAAAESDDVAVSVDLAAVPVPVEPSDAERWTVARAAVLAWRERPLLGHGAGSFRLVFPAVKPESVGLFYEHAHNDYLQTLVERGVVGLLLYLAAVGLLMLAAVQALRRRSDSLSRGLALATIAAAVAIGVHSLVDFNLQIAANLFWFQICLLFGAVAHVLPLRTGTTADPEGQVAQ
jgi:putative inorganic carbon (hco3(-)) transporter